MCFSEMMAILKQQGLSVTESQIRWAIRRGHVSRPPMSGSLQFRFSESLVAEIATYFRSRQSTAV
jgi:hypothetical protein